MERVGLGSSRLRLLLRLLLRKLRLWRWLKLRLRCLLLPRVPLRILLALVGLLAAARIDRGAPAVGVVLWRGLLLLLGSPVRT